MYMRVCVDRCDLSLIVGYLKSSLLMSGNKEQTGAVCGAAAALTLAASVRLGSAHCALIL